MTIDLLGVLENGENRGAAVPRDPRRELRVHRGGAVLVRLTVRTAGGGLVDLTSATLTLTVKKPPPDDGPGLLTKTATIVAADGPGRADLTLTSADTKLLDVGRYAYDVIYLPLGGTRDVIVPLSGLVVLAGVAPPP